MGLSRIEEEFLEAVWTAHEQGKSSVADVLAESEDDIRAAPPDLERNGYIARDGENVVLTEKGEEAALMLVRCHRLAECLMWQGLRMDSTRMEPVACAFEHILLPEIVDSICVLLGHPRLCPHGKPIPPGTCCTEAWASVSQALAALPAVEPGTTVTIACLRPPHPGQIQRLLALGLLPGKDVTVRQTEPAVLLSVGGGELAIDRDSAASVFVWTRAAEPPGRRNRARYWRFMMGRKGRRG